MTKSSGDKYTDPELRDTIKEEIQEGDKGGEPGQWSARKAQMMAKEYKAQGGEYKDDEKDDKAKHLDKWTDEDWQTKDGDGDARKDGETHRYLPKKAWDKMTDEEKEATDNQKVEGSKAGDQYVPNTEKAKRSRREVSQEDEEAAAQDDSAEQKDESDDNDAANDDEEKGPAKRSRTNKKQDVSECKKSGDDSEKKAGKDEEGETEEADEDADIPVGNPDDEEEDEEEEGQQYLEDDEDEEASEDLEEVDGDEDFDPEADD